MDSQATLQKLAAEFPPDAHKTRKGALNRDLTYLETHSVIHRLNDLGVQWHWHISEMVWRPDMLVVRGTLSIDGLGSRDGIGIQEISDKRGGDLVKGASSDALKKAATLFGVGLYLYGPDYAEESATGPQNARSDMWGKPPPRTPNQEPDPDIPPIDGGLAQWLDNKMGERGLETADRLTLLLGLYNVNDLRKLDQAQGMGLRHILTSDSDVDLVARIDHLADVMD